MEELECIRPMYYLQIILKFMTFDAYTRCLIEVDGKILTLRGLLHQSWLYYSFLDNSSITGNIILQ